MTSTYSRSGRVKVHGQGIPVPGDGPKTAKIAIVGLAPAKEEQRLGRPFVGPSGKQLDQCLTLAGVDRYEVYVTNVSDRYIPIGSGVPDMDPSYYEDCQRRLASEFNAMPNLTTIIPLGDALIPITGKTGITRWRGSILPTILPVGYRAVPSVHPAWLIRGQWEFRGVLAFDIKRAVKESTLPGNVLALPNVPTITGPSFAQVEAALAYYRELSEDALLSIDLEMHHRQFIACIGLYDGERPAICTPFVYGNGKPVWSIGEEAWIWREMSRLFEHGKARLCGQNLSFDLIRLLWENGVSMQPPWMDTMHAHHALMPELPHSLAFINSIYTRLPYYKDDGKSWDPKIGEKSFWEYNCKDAWATWHCAKGLEADLRREKLWDTYVNAYTKRFRIAIRMEYEGIRVDTASWKDVVTELEQQIDTQQKVIDREVGYPIKVNSPKQIKDLLYTKRRWVPVISRKTHQPTVDVEALRSLHMKYNDPLVLKIIEQRQTLDLKGDIFDQEIGSDGRIRCHYSQIGTVTGGRWSSSASVTGSGMNLQNVPSKGPARKMFLPDKDHVFIEADQVQAEVMAVGWMGPVPGLIKLFREGRDIHMEVAKMIAQVVRDHKIRVPGGMFMCDPDTMDKLTHKDERYVAKRTVHASNYDMGAKRHASVTSIPVALSEILLTIYHVTLFPEIRSLYHTGIQRELRTTRTLWVPYFNTRRVFLGYWDSGGELLRAAYAHKPQALVGHITGRIMELIEDELLDRGAAIRMQVHDSVIVSARPEQVDWVIELIDKAAKSIVIHLPGGPLTIPMSYKVGPSYGELRDYR
jgi:uracil-DNA glycosylase family 4